VAKPKEDIDFGTPGPALARQSPFYQGFFWVLGGLVAVVLGLAVREAAAELELVLISAFLAVGLQPLVALAQRRGMKRGWAVLCVAVVFVALITAVVFVLGSALRTQITRLVNEAPQLLEDLRHNRSIARLDARYHVLSALEDKLKNPDLADNVADSLFSAGASVLNAIVSTVIVFALTLYFLAALPRITTAAYSLAPASRRERVSKLADEILRRAGGYATGAVLVALIAGTATLILMFSVGLGRYALALALLVALLDLVPLVGALIGASVVCLVGFATSLTVGIVCVVFYVIYETLEGYVIYPRVMRSSVDVPEYVTILAVLIGGGVGGIVGALMALPTAAAVLLLTREVWVRRQDNA
jgi:predicted PurR-regulated permease PerM